jgi:ATP-dependent DNA helicase RecQ
LRQAIVNGFFSKDIENYGLLKITDKGKAFLKKPTSIKFTRDNDFSNAESDHDDDLAAGGKGSSTTDEVLYAMLKDVTKKIAKQNNLPPYIIFNEISLEEMSIQYPITMEELAKITGVGTGKAAKYGKLVLDIIKKHVEENDIERPSDMVIKSVVNKSGLKVFIIQNIDRKVSLEDMAKNKNLKMNDLLTEIETIVASGTKVNINYYIDQTIDDDKKDDIYECLREAETDDINAILKELGEDEYSEEEVRLLRIKFISEFGN